MEIVLAKTAGFCFGVKRAVGMAYDRAGEDSVFTYGPIIHNDEVIKDLAGKGVHAISSIDDLPKDKGTIIIRSHGISKEEFIAIENKGVRVIDATCPFVKKIHNIVVEMGNEGREIIIIGDRDHPEVQAIRGWCVTPCTILDTKEEAENLQLDSSKAFAIVAQTTFNYKKFNDLVDIILRKCYDVICLDTVCNATQDRQYEARNIASHVDAMIVIGDKKSSNSQKLYEICRKGCSNTYFIQTVDNLRPEYFSSVKKVGITAGASTPNSILEEVQTYVRKF